MSQLLRPWRDQTFRLLAAALAIASFALATMILLRAELENHFVVQTAEALGGDLVLSGSRKPEAAQRSIFTRHASRQTELIDFSTVLVLEENILLVSARAVDVSYPLYGSMSIAAGRFDSAISVSTGPRPGEVWVDNQVLDRLGMEVGESVAVGRKTLKISALIRQLPDQSAGFYSMNPRIVFNQADLESTGVVGPGARLHHHLMLAADKESVAAISLKLDEHLRPDQRMETTDNAAVRSMGPLRQLTLWANLAVLLICLLCGAAIYLATAQRVRQRARLAGLLRTFGARRYQIIGRLLGNEFLAVLPAALLSTSLGIGTVLGLKRVLNWDGPLAASPGDWLALIFSPIVLWAAFALPRLSALVRVPAIEVLRQGNRQAAFSVQTELLAVLAGPILLASFLTRSFADLGQLVLLLILLAALLPAILWPLLKLFDLLSRAFPTALRLALRRLARRPYLTLPLMASLTLAMAILALAGHTGSGLLDNWRTTLPEKAPNHFVLNLYDRDLPTYRQWLTDHQARSQALYPVVRGRLTEINGTPVREAVSKENKAGERHLNRDLVLTEAKHLPASNIIIEGQWKTPDNAPTPLSTVSVEQKLAERMGLKLGDKLQFVTSRGKLEPTITSIREVDWNSFAPNFYFMFSEGSLKGEDITWLTSFWLREGDGKRLAKLIRTLPQLTLLDVSVLLDKTQKIVSQASRAVSLIALLLMFSALLVLASAVLSGQAQRGRDNALLRTLGARHQLLRRVTWLEFLILSGGAATGATLLTFAALYPIGKQLLIGTSQISPWLLLPAALAIMVAIGGVALSRQALSTPPLDLLRREQG